MPLLTLCRSIRWILFAGLVAPAAWADHVPADPGVTVITREELESSGYVTLGDVLQRLPIHGTTRNPLFNSGGNGEHRVDFLDLESQRTLVLVDGQRWIEGTDGAVDVSGIPFAAIERIEVRHVGDGARHGSGAIGGVVNVVLRERHDGAQARAWVGEFDEGDGRAQHYDLTIGSGTERAQALVNVSYAKQEPVSGGDRAISAVPLFGFDPNDVTQGASSTTPFGRFDGPGIPGTVVLIPGEDGRERTDFRTFDATRDGFNGAPDSYVLTPSERVSLYARTRYALTDAVAFTASALYNERRSQIRFAPLPLAIGTVFFGNAGPFGFDVPVNNVFNPFGVPIARVQFRTPRAPQTFDANVDTLRVAASFDGRAALLDRDVDWSLYASYADVEELETVRGLFDPARLRLGLGPSFLASDGTPVCGTPAAPIDGCVPINVFGGPAGFTQAMLDYAGVRLKNARGADQTAFGAQFDGDVAALPAGALRLSGGYEHRRVSGFRAPDALGVTIDNDRGFTGGHSVGETYVALDAPLVAERPFAHALALGIAARRVDYSADDASPSSSDPRAPFDFGGDGDGGRTLLSGALQWSPRPTVRVDAGWSEGARVPAVEETAGPAALSFGNAFDPCYASSRAFYPAFVAERCRTGFGGVAPVDEFFDENNATHPYVTGGNPALEPERSRTVHAALAWSPERWPGAAVRVGWQRTRVDGRIGRSSEEAVLESCYIAGDLDACGLIDRSDGGIANVFSGNRNLPGTLEVEHYDAGLSYATETPLGAFDARLDVVYLADYAVRGVPASPNPFVRAAPQPAVGENATEPLHRMRANAGTAWRRGDWTLHGGARYRSGVDESCALPQVLDREDLCTTAATPANPSGERRLGSTTYVDLQLDWAAPWHGRVGVGVRNVFDRDPPVSFTTTGGFARDAEVPGRFFYVSYAQAF